jgi:hypothetical protein
MLLKATASSSVLSRSLLWANSNSSSSFIYKKLSFKCINSGTLSKKLSPIQSYISTNRCEYLSKYNQGQTSSRAIIDLVQKNSIFTSCCLYNDGKQSNEKQPQIISSQMPVSDELKNIMSKKFMTDEEQPVKNQEKTGNSGDGSGEKEEPPKGKLALLFSKEHAWKVTLTFFVALFGGSFVYILVDWGSPRLDENNQIVSNKLTFLVDLPQRNIKVDLPKENIK